MFSEFFLRNLCLPFGSFFKKLQFYLFICSLLAWPCSMQDLNFLIKDKTRTCRSGSTVFYTTQEFPLNFVILNSTLESKIHEILNLVWCEVGDWAHCFTIQMPCDFSTICWKRFPSSLELLYCFCQKLIHHIHICLCTISQAALIHVPILMLITNCYQAVLMTVALY